MPKRWKEYYGHPIKPQFDPVKVWPKFETTAQIAAEQSERISLLLGSPYAPAGHVLRNCNDDEPCQSGACAICGTKYHRWFSAAAMEAMADEERIFMLTYAPDPQFPPDFPVDLRVDQLRERFIRRLERLERKIESPIRFVGTVEVSINNKFRGLVPHIHAVVSGATRAQLKSAHPGQGDEKLIKYPWVVSKLPVPDNDRPRVFTYLYKMISPGRNFLIKFTDEAKRLIKLARLHVDPHVNLEVERLAALHEYCHTDLRVLRGVSQFDIAKLRVPKDHRLQRDERKWDRIGGPPDWSQHPQSPVVKKTIKLAFGD